MGLSTLSFEKETLFRPEAIGALLEEIDTKYRWVQLGAIDTRKLPPIGEISPLATLPNRGIVYYQTTGHPTETQLLSIEPDRIRYHRCGVYKAKWQESNGVFQLVETSFDLTEYYQAFLKNWLSIERTETCWKIGTAWYTRSGLSFHTSVIPTVIARPIDIISDGKSYNAPGDGRLANGLLFEPMLGFDSS